MQEGLFWCGQSAQTVIGFSALIYQEKSTANMTVSD
jgi:hypothetical protein